MNNNCKQTQSIINWIVNQWISMNFGFNIFNLDFISTVAIIIMLIIMMKTIMKGSHSTLYESKILQCFDHHHYHDHHHQVEDRKQRNCLAHEKK